MDTKALRQKILDLAIRGKLVPQDPNEEPASVLLEKIRAEKQQMVKDGRLKTKDIKNDTIIFKGEDNLHYEKFQDGSVKCIEDEIPFEVPEGWVWCRFTSVTVNRDSERKPISSANRTNVAKIYDYYGASGKIDKIDKFIFNEKLLLIGEDGANLVTRSKPIAFFAEGQYWVNNHAHCIDSTDKLILEYLCLYINAISLEKYVTGSAQPKMTKDNMNSILIALPPYEEQKRLEFQVNHILKTVSTIENEKEDIVNYIVSAKSKILDFAIRGKLVPQDPNDEPASVLLERIRAEKEELIKQGKIKRDKKASIIFRGEDNSYYETISNNTICIDEEVPFDLPDGWIWCRLKSLADPHENSFVDGPFGSNLKTDHYTDRREVRIIQLNNIGEFTWKNNGIKYTTYSHAETLSRCKSYPGDIVIAKMMPAGRAIIIPDIEDVYVISSDCVRLQLPNYIDKKYVMYMINSPTINKSVMENVQGIGRTRTSLSKLKELLVPIPPYKQQCQISATFDKSLFYFDMINALCE